MIIKNLLKDTLYKNGNSHKVGKPPKFSDVLVSLLLRSYSAGLIFNNEFW